RLDQLSQEVDAAETALAQFRRQNSLLVPEGQSLPVEVALNASVQGLARLRAQSLAQEVLVTQLSEQIASGDVESVRVPPEDRTPALIQFETRYAELQQQEQQLLQRLQEDEPMVRDVRLEQGQLRDLMLREFRRIRDRIDNRSKALQREVSATEASIDALRSDYGNDADLMIELRQFERQATIKRDLYEELLEQYNSASQLLTFEGATARVLAWAVPPERKSGPASRKLALLAAFGGFVFGAGIALLLDLVERGYRRNRDLVRDLNVPVLGVFPKLRRNGLGEISQRLTGSRRRGTAIRTPRPLRKYVFAANFRGSVAAEAMRSIHVRLLLKRNAPGPQTSGHVVGITSTADGEGKTMTAVNLAAYLAEQGESVALLDTDLFKKTLSIDVAKAVPRQNDIMRLMRDPTLACEAFQPTELYEDLYVIGFIGGKEAAHLKTRDLQHFEEAVRRLRARFDYILLDLPPAQGEPRTQLLERYCDDLVYVVHWGKTVRDSVKAIFQNHRINTKRVLGVLFTQAPLGAYRAYNRTELHH
ncbi:MAG: AAA family ATPase, partial [Pseudomonadota bacterium]